MLLKPNRSVQAWAIWLPVAWNLGLLAAIRNPALKVPADVANFFCSAGTGLTFALAALWLASYILSWRHRFLTFLAMLVGLGVAGAAAGFLSEGLEQGLQGAFVGMAVGFAALIISLSLTLAGWLSRHAYAPVRLTVWTVAWCAIVTAATMAPFVVFAMVSQGGVPLGQFFGAIALVAGACAGLVLPFLIVSFVNAVFRERLKGLLHLGDARTPPMLRPESETLSQLVNHESEIKSL